MFDFLYEDIGGKIKRMAKWTFIIEAIASIITGIALAINEYDGGYLLICIFGPIVAWVSSWLLYAFGQIVEDVHAIRDKERPIENTQQTNPALESAVAQISNFIQNHSGNKKDDTPQTAVTQVEEQKKTQAKVYVVGSDISAGKYTIFSTDYQGGMVYIHSLDNEFLDKRYIKTKEKISLKNGTRVKLFNCEISF